VIRRINHVQIAAPEGGEEAARAYYGELLGLEEIPKPPLLRATGGVWFTLGEQELHIGIEQGHRPARKAHPAFEVDQPADLEQLAARLAAAGYAVSWDDRMEGVPRFHTEDAFGNRLEIQSR
jgi:catechol 2,3-dioxygenase-like lactoylglutathione lyase family enzyme